VAVPPRLDAAAARLGVSARELMLALVADGLARLDVPPRFVTFTWTFRRVQAKRAHCMGSAKNTVS
jgi:hypothetical protein